MSIFLAGRSALEYRRHHLMRTDAHSYAVPFRNSLPSLHEIRAALNGSCRGITTPVEVLVSGAAHKRQSANCELVIYRHWCCNLPAKAFDLVDEGAQIYVSHPLFAYIQEAKYLDLYGLIALGCELCGTYCLDSAIPAGFYPCESIANPSDLQRAARSISGYDGRKQAVRATRYVFEKSASPRETALALLLCLPCNLGGYGLPVPELNYTLAPARRDLSHASQRAFICDLYWKQAKLDVEYDSDAFHTGAEKIAHDARRRSELALLGVQSITVTNAQLRSFVETDKLAHAIARGLGTYIRTGRVSDWFMRHRELRSSLIAPKTALS